VEERQLIVLPLKHFNVEDWADGIRKIANISVTNAKSSHVTLPPPQITVAHGFKSINKFRLALTNRND